MFKKLIYLSCLFLLVSVTVNNASAELVGWWKFDGDLIDSSGNDNIATPVGNPAFIEGMLGQAVNLNSTTTEDYINCGPNMGFATIGDGGEADGLSIAVWVNRTVTGDDHKICSNLSTPGWGAGEGLQLAIFRNRVELDMRDSTGRFFSRDVDAIGFTEMEYDRWYHIVFVFDDVADTLTEYIDGVKTHTIEGVPTSLAASPVDFLIGSQQPTFNSGRVFRGMIDDFRLYSNAVTEEEVQTIMQGGSIGITGTAAMVVSSADLSAGFDQAQKDRLESLGYEVTVTTGDDVSGGTFTAEDAETFDVLIVSETISSSAANNLIGANVPMMHEESYGWSRHFFTLGLNKVWLNDPNGMMDIVNDVHPIIADAGLSVGPVKFFNNPAASWTTDTVASLVPGAENLAQITNSEGEAYTIIFAIEAGTELADASLAANRVVGFSIPGDQPYVAADMTDEAWALFDSAIAWLDPPEAPPAAAMVVSSADLSAGFDQAQKDRLESLGYAVTVTTGDDVSGGAFTAEDAETFDVLVVSESISSSAANNLIGANVPMMHEESYGWSRHFFTQGLNKVWLNDPDGMMDVVNDTHPIIADAGVSAGPVKFFNNPAASWTTDTVASLVPGAENLAQITNSEGEAYTIIFAIEAGTELADASLAANRVVGFSIPGDQPYVAADMTDDAWALFDSAIAWLDAAD